MGWVPRGVRAKQQVGGQEHTDSSKGTEERRGKVVR